MRTKLLNIDNNFLFQAKVGHVEKKKNKYRTTLQKIKYFFNFSEKENIATYDGLFKHCIVFTKNKYNVGDIIVFNIKDIYFYERKFNKKYPNQEKNDIGIKIINDRYYTNNDLVKLNNYYRTQKGSIEKINKGTEEMKKILRQKQYEKKLLTIVGAVA